MADEGLSTLANRDLPYYGFLTRANLEAVAARIKSMLTNRQHLLVATHEKTWPVPEVFQGLSAKAVSTSASPGGRGWQVAVDTTAWPWGLFTAYETQEEALSAPQGYGRTFVQLFPSFGSIDVRHFDSDGHEACWVVRTGPRR